MSAERTKQRLIDNFLSGHGVFPVVRDDTCFVINGEGASWKLADRLRQVFHLDAYALAFKNSQKPRHQILQMHYILQTDYDDMSGLKEFKSLFNYDVFFWCIEKGSLPPKKYWWLPIFVDRTDFLIWDNLCKSGNPMFINLYGNKFQVSLPDFAKVMGE